MSYKTTEKDDVKRVAEQLIEDNGSTTNLDVKMQLRKEGYYATQGIISNFMSELIDDEGWHVTNNGRFRTVGHSDVSAVNVVSSSAGFPGSVLSDDSDDFKPGKRYVRRDGIELVSLSQPTPGDWIISDANGINHSLVFDGRFTRDQVRQAYSSICGIDFTDTRSRRQTS